MYSLKDMNQLKIKSNYFQMNVMSEYHCKVVIFHTIQVTYVFYVAIVSQTVMFYVYTRLICLCLCNMFTNYLYHYKT